MAPGIVRAAQRRLGLALRDRVAGPDADGERARIWDSPGPRWFAPEDPVWVVHADASMFTGGITSLLLQSLHPLAMAGVAGHSGYRGDPWGRLQRTSRFIATTTYGPVPDAEALVATVRGIHDRVRGTADDGRRYRASDPELLRWVHVAEIWSFLHAHRAFGERPLTAAQQDTYVRQAGRSARLLGATDLPASVAELEAALEAARPGLRASPAALDAATFLLREPPLPRSARLGYDVLARGAVGLLPGWARDELGLRRPRGAHAAGLLGTRAVRWGMAAV